MGLTTAPELEIRRPAVVRLPTVPTSRRRNRLDPVVVVLGAAVLAHGVVAFAVQPFGDPAGVVVALRLGAVVALAVAAWIAWRRSPRVLRGAIELVAGAAGVIGGGIGAVLRLDDLPAIQRVSGVAAAVAGSALIVIGAVRLVASIRTRWRRVAAVPVGVIALAYILVPVGMGVLVTNRARPELGGRTPADVGLPYSEVRLPVEEDVQLAAWYVPSSNGAALLLLAGSGSTRDDVVDHASVLARNGYGVLLVDVAGHGGSRGEPMEYGWGGERYLVSAVDFLASRPDVTGRIGLVGISMGGEQGITLAAYDGRIEAVVADGASGRTLEDVLSRPDPLVAKAIGFPFSWLAFTTADLLSDESPPIALVDAIEAIAPRPLFLVATGTGAEREANRVFLETSDGGAVLWELPDVAHTRGLASHPEEYERRVISFLHRALLGGDAPLSHDPSLEA